jgi:hypothetical protein
LRLEALRPGTNGERKREHGCEHTANEARIRLGHETPERNWREEGR